jgi:hypothetical protein
LHDDEGRGLLAFVELDLGTMSHTRLKVKAGCYAAYAAHAAWVERYAFCPCLLFLTTTEARALAFLKKLATLLEKDGRGGVYDHRAENVSWFAAGACAMARTPQRGLCEPCWDDLTVSGGGLSLLDCLRAARAPYDTARAQEQAERDATEAERQRLHRDPHARRALLQEHRLYARCEHVEQFGTPGALALELLLASTEPMEEVERAAFVALAHQLDPDPLETQFAPEPVPPTPADREAVRRLAEVYRARHDRRISELARRHGFGPKLRRHRPSDLDLRSPAGSGLLDRAAVPFGDEQEEQWS